MARGTLSAGPRSFRSTSKAVSHTATTSGSPLWQQGGPLQHCPWRLKESEMNRVVVTLTELPRVRSTSLELCIMVGFSQRRKVHNVADRCPGAGQDLQNSPARARGMGRCARSREARLPGSACTGWSFVLDFARRTGRIYRPERRGKIHDGQDPL